MPCVGIGLYPVLPINQTVFRDSKSSRPPLTSPHSTNRLCTARSPRQCTAPVPVCIWYSHEPRLFSATANHRVHRSRVSARLTARVLRDHPVHALRRFPFASGIPTNPIRLPRRWIVAATAHESAPRLTVRVLRDYLVHVLRRYRFVVVDLGVEESACLGQGAQVGSVTLHHRDWGLRLDGGVTVP